MFHGPTGVSLPDATQVQLLTSTPTGVAALVQVTIDVSSSAASVPAVFWSNYVTCTIPDAIGVQGSTSQSPVVYVNGDGVSPGSEVNVSAIVDAGATATLTCQLLTSTPIGMPTISLFVSHATAVSIDAVNGFAGLTDFVPA
jgi:hypothetical protein